MAKGLGWFQLNWLLHCDQVDISMKELASSNSCKQLPHVGLSEWETMCVITSITWL